MHFSDLGWVAATFWTIRSTWRWATVLVLGWRGLQRAHRRDAAKVIRALAELVRSAN